MLINTIKSSALRGLRSALANPTAASAALLLLLALASPAAGAEQQSASTSTSASAGPRAPEPLLGLESNIANAKIQVSPRDMQAAAGHHHGKSHGKYYMYAESPKKGAYKMGFRRGNHKHLIERKESAHKGHVHSYFKWHDKKGKGSHKFEFKHYEHKKKGHYGK